MITKVGLDLGYANITLSNTPGDVYREPSVAVVDKNTRRVISVGSKAENSDTTACDGILVRPFLNGLLYSADLTKDIINHALAPIKSVDKIRCVFAMPSDFVPKQENEIFKMLAEAGVTECYSVNPAVAALIGAGYSPVISAISVNVGAAFTEIAVVHKGSVILSVRENVGGEDFDKAVKKYIFDQGDMNVSLLSARTIKERLGAVWQGREPDSIDIEGTLSLTGNKVKMTITDEDIVGVFEAPVKKLLQVIANTIKKIPIEYVQDIFENGVILSGGASEIYGLDIMMSRVFGISVTKAISPIDSVAKGLSRINTFIPSRSKYEGKNITNQLSNFYEAKKTAKK